MADLPDYYTAALISWAEIAGLKGGLDASKEAVPAAKEVYLATDTSKIYACYTAGVWTDITHACLLLAGGTMTGAIAMGNNKITGLAAPAAANDAVRKAYADLFTLLTTFNNHKARHQAGGDDLLDVTGLAGLLANDQHVLDAEAIAAMGALGDANPLNHDKYTDAAAKAAAVRAGAITNGETKAPTHDAVFDVKATADAALPAGNRYTDAEAVDAIEADGNIPVVTITFIIDGGGAAITTGIKGDLEIPFACTINRVTMLADQSGSIVVDIWKQAYADFPPENANSITASAPPTITTDTDSQDSTLTDWTTAITAGDCLRFNVDSVTDIERVTISLKVTKT